MILGHGDVFAGHLGKRYIASWPTCLHVQLQGLIGNINSALFFNFFYPEDIKKTEDERILRSFLNTCSQNPLS